MIYDLVKKTKSFVLCGLVFSFLMQACGPKKKPHTSILLADKDAKTVSIPLSLVSDSFNEFDINKITVQLANEHTPILGEFRIGSDAIIFTPLISFTPGLTYCVYFNLKLIAQFKIKEVLSMPPAVLNVFPIQDTIPENQLKLYITFSQPMQSGEVLQYLKLVKNERDTLTEVFLDLQNELWNKDQTMLTIWFNPGRVKRGLQPNEKSGTPLINGNTYKLIISNDWQGTNGKKLINNFDKKFFVVDRDSIGVSLDHWKIFASMQKNQTKLDIHLGEVLDHELLKNTISVLNEKNEIIPGRSIINDESNHIQIILDKMLPSEKYRLRVESHLEDLAGNNLNRLFDMEYNNRTIVNKPFFDKEFSIE